MCCERCLTSQIQAPLNSTLLINIAVILHNVLRQIQLFLTKPIYPFLYGLSFLLYRSSVYWVSFNLGQFFLLFCCFSLITIIVSIPLKRTVKDSLLPILILIAWVSVLHFAAFAKAFGFPYSDIPFLFFVALYGCIILLFYLLHTYVNPKISPHFPVINKTLNTFFLILSAIILISKFEETTHKKGLENSTTKKVDFHISNNCSTNILWILMDEYGSTEVLSKEFNFKNTLDDSLKKRGFLILPNIRSRNSSTLYSLLSIFNINDSITPSNFYEGKVLLNSAHWVPSLEENHFQFINLSPFNISHHPMMANRSGYPQSYFDQIFSGALFAILKMKYDYSPLKCDTYNQLLIQKIKDTFGIIHSSSPTFYWTHIPIPHEPFTRDSNGLIRQEYDLKDVAEVKNSYVGYVKYGNHIILDLLKHYPQIGNSIIIISGDHGPRYNFINDQKNKLSPYVAIRFPNHADTTYLNNIRYISEIPLAINKYLSGKQ